jgi:hypothetical protein
MFPRALISGEIVCRPCLFFPAPARVDISAAAVQCNVCKAPYRCLASTACHLWNEVAVKWIAFRFVFRRSRFEILTQRRAVMTRVFVDSWVPREENSNVSLPQRSQDVSFHILLVHTSLIVLPFAVLWWELVTASRVTKKNEIVAQNRGFSDREFYKHLRDNLIVNSARAKELIGVHLTKRVVA